MPESDGWATGAAQVTGFIYPSVMSLDQSKYTPNCLDSSARVQLSALGVVVRVKLRLERKNPDGTFSEVLGLCILSSLCQIIRKYPTAFLRCVSILPCNRMTVAVYTPALASYIGAVTRQSPLLSGRPLCIHRIDTHIDMPLLALLSLTSSQIQAVYTPLARSAIPFLRSPYSIHRRLLPLKGHSIRFLSLSASCSHLF